MKQKYKKRNSPRIQSAINRVLTMVYRVLDVAYGGRYRIVFYPYSSSSLGVSILMIAYGADKYDVLNSICPGAQRSVVTFARGDIRHKNNHLKKFVELLLLLLTALLLLELKEPC